MLKANLGHYNNLIKIFLVILFLILQSEHFGDLLKFIYSILTSLILIYNYIFLLNINN